MILFHKRNIVLPIDQIKKKNGDSQRSSGSQVPSLLNESPFFKDSISQPSDPVNRHLGYPMIRITKHVERLIGDFDYI